MSDLKSCMSVRWVVSEQTFGYKSVASEAEADLFKLRFFSSQQATDPSPSTRNLWEKAGSSLEASSLDNKQVDANPVEAIRYKKNMSCLLFNDV